MMDVGIDVGGTNLRAGVVDEQGKLLSRVSQPVGTLKSPEELIRRLTALKKDPLFEIGAYSLRACPGEEVILELKSSLSPALFKPLEGDSFLYLVLPVRLKAEDI